MPCSCRARRRWTRRRRNAIYVEAQKLILADAPWQPIYNPIDVMAIRDNVEGLKIGYMGRMLVNDARGGGEVGVMTPGRLATRLLGMIVALFAVSVFTFFALATIPGDAASAMIGDSASQEQLAALRDEMGLSASLPQRYLTFAAGLLHGDLGRSLVSGRPVSSMILERLPYTLLLSFERDHAGAIDRWVGRHDRRRARRRSA